MAQRAPLGARPVPARYAVTGATGFIGGRLARRLLAAGHRVTAIARDPQRAAALRDLGADVRRADLTDEPALRAAMEGADGLFHVAGWYRVGARDRVEGWRVNVEGTRAVLDAMRAAGVAKGVYTSTVAVFSDTRGRLVDETYRHDGPHLSEYDRTKWIAHYEVAEPRMRDGLPLVIVQPGMVYGPGDTSALRPSLVQFLRRRLPFVPGRTAMCWAHVDDIADAHVLAMERGAPGETYVIAGPPHTLVELFETAARIAGIPAPRLHPGPGLMRATTALLDLVGRVLPLEGTYSAEGTRVVAGVTYLASDAKARRALGFAPRPLAEGLRETLVHEMRLLGLVPPA